MYIAEHYAKQRARVLLVEKENDFMQGASYINQARVHNGYHYPRSILTAFRSRLSFPKFVDEFKECIDDSFEKYYMIGKLLSNITAKQFELFCRRIDAPCNLVDHQFRNIVNPNLIEAVFSTTEYAFNAEKIKNKMHERITSAGVKIKLNTSVSKIMPGTNEIQLKYISGDKDNNEQVIRSKSVFNCTYSMINNTLYNSNIEVIPLKHELTELCIVDVPQYFKDKGITVMCGPFFSLMPFPTESLHSFSHVRYTPHYHWHDSIGNNYTNADKRLNEHTGNSNWKKMIIDAARYIPELSNCRLKKSLWVVKTVLPRSEENDSRPILYKSNHAIPGLHCVLGGKIDNVYDIIDNICKDIK